MMTSSVVEEGEGSLYASVFFPDPEIIIEILPRIEGFIKEGRQGNPGADKMTHLEGYKGITGEDIFNAVEKRQLFWAFLRGGLSFLKAPDGTPDAVIGFQIGRYVF